MSVRTADIELSGLLASPAASSATPRGLVLALHGGGYSAGYWNCPTGGASLLELGAALGYHVLAVDRPGYGAAQAFDPQRLGLASQVDLLFDVVAAWSAARRFDGPVFVIGHSIGGILALLMAAHPRGRVLAAIDVLGVPLRLPDSAAGREVQSWPLDQPHLPLLAEKLRKSLVMGPPGTYTADADDYDRTLVRPMPRQEYVEAIAMPASWPRVLPTIRLPVQFNAPEFDVIQGADMKVLEEVRGMLSGSPYAAIHLQVASGHNASVHRIARAYHLRALAFFDECRALAAT